MLDLTTAYARYRGRSLVGTDGEPISTWEDSGTGANNLTQSGTNRPRIVRPGLNGRPFVRFESDLSCSLFAATAADWNFLHNGDAFTAAIIWRPNRLGDLGNRNALLDTSGNSSVNIGLTLALDDVGATYHRGLIYIPKADSPNYTLLHSTANAIQSPPNDWQFWILTCDGSGSYRLRVGNDFDTGAIAQDNAPSVADATHALRLGAVNGGGYFSDVDLAEVLLFKSELTGTDLQDLWDYGKDEFGISVRYTVSTGGGYDAFPSLAHIGDQSILCSYRAGVHHQNDAGKLAVRQSDDLGKTWGSERIWLDTDPDDAGIPSMTRLRDGRILVTFIRRGPGTPGTNYPNACRYRISSDNGRTLPGPTNIIVTGFTSVDITAARLLELASGKWLMPVYGKDTGDTYWSTKVCISLDEGANWTQVLIGDGETDNKNYSEMEIIEDPANPGVLYGAVRDDTGNSHWWTRSTDSGDTWSALDLIVAGSVGRPNIVLTDDGMVIIYQRRLGATNNRTAVMWTTNPNSDSPTWNSGSVDWTASDEQMVYVGPVNVGGHVLQAYATEDGGLDSEHSSIYFRSMPGANAIVLEPAQRAGLVAALDRDADYIALKTNAGVAAIEAAKV